MGKYRAAVFFDVDHTLWDFKAVLTAAHHALHAELQRHHPGLNIPKDEWDNDRKTARNTHPWSTGLKGLRIIATEITLSRHGIYTPQLRDALVEAFWTQRENYPHVYPDAATTLPALAPHYFLGTLTNGGSTLPKTPLAAHLQAHIGAPSVGHQKPHPAMFAAADTAAPPDIPRVIVGDSPTNDIQGGLDAGWTTIWINRADATTSPVAHATIHTLTELPGVLESLIPSKN